MKIPFPELSVHRAASSRLVKHEGLNQCNLLALSPGKLRGIIVQMAFHIGVSNEVLSPTWNFCALCEHSERKTKILLNAEPLEQRVILRQVTYLSSVSNFGF